DYQRNKNSHYCTASKGEGEEYDGCEAIGVFPFPLPGRAGTLSLSPKGREKLEKIAIKTF
ncbi:MAG TPA: hypothetical protein VGB16_03015, partial [candidate division Zixibacteria bacterium]